MGTGVITGAFDWIWALVAVLSSCCKTESSCRASFSSTETDSAIGGGTNELAALVSAAICPQVFVVCDEPSSDAAGGGATADQYLTSASLSFKFRFSSPLSAGAASFESDTSSTSSSVDVGKSRLSSKSCSKSVDANMKL